VLTGNSIEALSICSRLLHSVKYTGGGSLCLLRLVGNCTVAVSGGSESLPSAVVHFLAPVAR
jgi:hypothetical protein